MLNSNQHRRQQLSPKSTPPSRYYIHNRQSHHSINVIPLLLQSLWEALPVVITAVVIGGMLILYLNYLHHPSPKPDVVVYKTKRSCNNARQRASYRSRRVQVGLAPLAALSLSSHFMPTHYSLLFLTRYAD
ncbi:hypothetical protein SK128_005632, partial [Halocaridina rubra]